MFYVLKFFLFFTFFSGFVEKPALSSKDVCKIDNKVVLAQQLKEVYRNGKEICPKQSAEILHRLGQLYSKQNPNMIKLIQCAALYNAAIARSPDNVNAIKNDLKQLCNQVLRLADAKNLNANLITASKQVKQEIEQMRLKVDTKLYSLQNKEKFIKFYKTRKNIELYKIKSIKNYQESIAEDYTNIMANLAKYCENVMGVAPCKFALVGLGSLARKEITPYSDFEHIIVLEEMSNKKTSNQNVLNYFRWFSVIFQIILINLQETILPSVVIEGLNSSNDDWFFDKITKRGISFDGMLPHACKFPLGRQQHTENKQWTTELIKPINEMLKYLKTEEDIKNGYHLKDILTKVCYVYGNKAIFKKFHDSIFNMTDNQDKEEKGKEIKQQIIDDLESFTVSSNIFKLKSSTSINIKALFYRSITLFVTALGRINNICASSCFDIIEELAAEKIISDYAKHKLLFAVGLACEVRLKWYMRCKRQNDTIEYESKNKTAVELLLNLVRKPDLFTFFQTTYALHCDISKQLDLKKKHFYTNPNILICHLHLVFDKVTNIKYIKFEKEESNLTISKYLKNFDEIMKQFETATKSNKQFKNSDLDEDFAITLHEIGCSLLNMNKHDEALEYLQRAMKIKELVSLDLNANESFAINLYSIGSCLLNMNKHDEALKYLQRAMKIKEQVSLDLNTDKSFASTLHEIGRCLLNINKHDEALKYLQRAMKIKEQVSLNLNTDKSFAITLHEIGCCLLNMNKHDEALEYLQRAMKIKEQVSLDLNTDESFAIILHNIGICLLNMNKHDEALKYLQRAMKIKEQVSLDLNTNESFAITLHNIGNCLLNMNKHDEALKYLQRAMKIIEQVSLNLNTDKSFASTLHEIGRCLLNMNKHDEALKYLQRAMKIKEQVSLDLNTDESFAITLHNIGSCLLNMNKHDEALKYIQRVMKIKEQVSLDLNTDKSFASTLHEIGRCLLNMNKHDEALKYLQRAMKIKEQVSLDLNTDKSFASTLHEIGRYLLNMNKHDEALKYLQRAMKIKEQVSLDLNTDKSFAITLHNIEICLLNMNKHDEALKYLQRAMKIQEQASLDLNIDKSFASTLHEIGRCLLNMNKHDDALKYLQRAMKIIEQVSLDLNTDKSFASTLHEIGRYLLNMNKHNEALKYLQRAMKIKEQVSLDLNTDKSFASTLHEIGRCLLNMNKHDEALKYLQRAMKIKEQVSLNLNTDKSFASTLHEIGRCLLNMNKHDEALKYLQRAIKIKEQVSLDLNTDKSFASTLHNIGSFY